MCKMDRGDPVLVPQWYKSANGNTTNHARLNYHRTSFRHSDENGVAVISRTRNGSLSDRGRKSSSLRRSFSSNGFISEKSQAYSSFRSNSRKRNQEKDSLLCDRENRSVLVDNGFHDSCDFFGGISRENDIRWRSQSMITERKMDTWPTKLETFGNNGGFSVTSTTSAVTKTSFEKDFPSLGTEGKPSLTDVNDTLIRGFKTTVQSIPVSSLVIIGTSALVEVPGKIEANGDGLSSALKTASVSHIPITSTTMIGLNMAEALAQAPSQNRNAPQVSIDTQKIEELNLRKCKRLIPVTPPMPKAFVSNTVEKAKSKGSRGTELIVPNKVGQQSIIQPLNYTLHSSVRSDVAKQSQPGNLQVLNREKNVISPTAKDAMNIGNKVNPFGFASSASSLPVKNPTDQELPSSTQSSFGERKLISQVQKRTDFFNLLRKRSSAIREVLPEAGSCLDESNMQIQHSTSIHRKDDISLISGLDYSPENGNFNTNEGPEELSDIAETNFDAVDDPEEEAFLQSLGWDKSDKEEALTKEEIDDFLRKYEKQRPSKLALQPMRCLNDANEA